MGKAAEDLPHIDEHSVAVGTAPLVVWDAMLHVVEQAFASYPAVVVRALGCGDVDVRGPRPLAVGSAFPGFHVVAATTGYELSTAKRLCTGRQGAADAAPTLGSRCWTGRPPYSAAIRSASTARSSAPPWVQDHTCTEHFGCLG